MDPRGNFGRWSTVCIDAGIAPSESDYRRVRRVRRAWGGLGRHYRTLTHLDLKGVRSVSPLRDLTPLRLHRRNSHSSSETTALTMIIVMNGK